LQGIRVRDKRKRWKEGKVKGKIRKKKRSGILDNRNLTNLVLQEKGDAQKESSSLGNQPNQKKELY